MALTSRQIEMIVVDYLAKKPPRIDTEEAHEFLERFKKDEELAAENGWAIELPFEVMPDDDDGEL